LRFVSDKEILHKECKRCDRVIEGGLVGEKLIEILKQSKSAIGLAANQIGIDIAVCVVYVRNPIVLVNPKINKKFGKSFFQEGCLSFPGDYIFTERWTNIVVSSDNHSKDLIFSFQKDSLECVYVQHEIDHLHGITMFHRAANMEI